MAKTPPVPQAVRQITDEVTSRVTAPEGAGAALGLPKVDWGKLLPQLVSPLLEIAGMGVDGHLDATEARRIADIVLETIRRVRSGA